MFVVHGTKKFLDRVHSTTPPAPALLAAAVNLARLAVLALASTPGRGWATAAG